MLMMLTADVERKESHHVSKVVLGRRLDQIFREAHMDGELLESSISG